MRIVNEGIFTEALDSKATEAFYNENIKKEIERKIKEVTGISCNLQGEAGNRAFLLKDTKNYITKIGAFSAVLEEIHFQGQFNLRDDFSFNGEIDFRYTSKSGGTNGLTIFRFYKLYDGKIVYKDEAGKNL